MKISLIFSLALLVKTTIAFAGICDFCGYILNKKEKCPYDKQHDILIRTIDRMLNEHSENFKELRLYDDNPYDVDSSSHQPYGQADILRPNFIIENENTNDQTLLLPPRSIEYYNTDNSESTTLPQGAEYEASFLSSSPQAVMNSDLTDLTFMKSKQRKQQWGEMAARANKYSRHSPEFKKMWEENYNISISLIPYDEHYHLNSAVCLTKLGHFERALRMIEYALSVDKVRQNKGLSFALMRQIAFIYGLRCDWKGAIDIYLKIYPPHSEVGRYIEFIDEAMDEISNSSTLSECSISAIKRWRSTLKIESLIKKSRK